MLGVQLEEAFGIAYAFFRHVLQGHVQSGLEISEVDLDQADIIYKGLYFDVLAFGKMVIDLVNELGVQLRMAHALPYEVVLDHSALEAPAEQFALDRVAIVIDLSPQLIEQGLDVGCLVGLAADHLHEVFVGDLVALIKVEHREHVLGFFLREVVAEALEEAIELVPVDVSVAVAVELVEEGAEIDVVLLDDLVDAGENVSGIEVVFSDDVDEVLVGDVLLVVLIEVVEDGVQLVLLELDAEHADGGLELAELDFAVLVQIDFAEGVLNLLVVLVVQVLPEQLLADQLDRGLDVHVLGLHDVVLELH